MFTQSRTRNISYRGQVKIISYSFILKFPMTGITRDQTDTQKLKPQSTSAPCRLAAGQFGRFAPPCEKQNILLTKKPPLFFFFVDSAEYFSVCSNMPVLIIFSFL